jgi:hypothetical protein
MKNISKYIILFILLLIYSACGDADIRLYPSLKFALDFEFGDKPGQPPGEGSPEDEKSLDIEEVIAAIVAMDIEGTIEDVVLERVAYTGDVDYEGELEELELSIKLIIDDEAYDIVSELTVSIESLRSGEEFNLAGELNEEGVALLIESIELLIEKVMNEESLEDFNRSIKLSVDNLPPDEEIYVKIILKYALAVRYKETISLL